MSEDKNTKEKTVQTGEKKRSRKFFWWFLAVQLIPLVGIPITWHRYNRVWVLIILVNTTVYCFNLARFLGSGSAEDARGNRLMVFVVAATFAAMALAWGVLMAADGSITFPLSD